MVSVKPGKEVLYIFNFALLSKGLVFCWGLQVGRLTPQGSFAVLLLCVPRVSQKPTFILTSQQGDPDLLRYYKVRPQIKIGPRIRFMVA